MLGTGGGGGGGGTGGVGVGDGVGDGAGVGPGAVWRSGDRFQHNDGGRVDDVACSGRDARATCARPRDACVPRGVGRDVRRGDLADVRDEVHLSARRDGGTLPGRRRDDELGGPSANWELARR